MKYSTNAIFIQPSHKDYSPDSEEEIHPNFVISRKSDGSIYSFYKDDVWDFSPYSTRNCIFSFTSWSDKEDVYAKDFVVLLQNEAKRLTWYKIFKPIRKGIKVKVSTVSGWFTILRHILRIALKLKLTLEQCPQDPRFKVSLCSSLSQCKGRKLLGILFFLKDIAFINVKYMDLCSHLILCPNQLDSYISFIEKLIKNQNNNDNNRTPLIPTRIMSSIINQALTQLSQLYPYQDKLLELSKRCVTDYNFFCETYTACSLRGGSRSINKPLVSPVQALAEYGLSDIVDIQADQPKAFPRLKCWFARMLSLARILVYAFTGMRDHEVRVMSHDCFEKIDIPGMESIPLIKSHSSKMEVGNYSDKVLYWATSNDLEAVIGLAKTISLCQILFQTQGGFNVNNYNLKNTPLWACNRITKSYKNHYKLSYVSSSTWLSSLQLTDVFKMPHFLVITEQDRTELEIFDAFNNWSDQRFSVGKIWPLATHQFRRSVAVYAARSGMVSLPSLGTQFKHLNLTMVQLYAENSVFAQNFVCNEKGIISEQYKVVESFEYAIALNKTIAFEENVINAKYKLTGARGLMIQRLKDKGELITFLGDRDDITKKMLTGELSYIETDVGGCMRKTLCSKYGVSLVVPCFSGCIYALIGGDNGEKLRNYKESLEFALNDLDKESRPYKSLLKEIRNINIKLLEDSNQGESDEC